MSLCAVMPKIILLMMIIFYCQGFPLKDKKITETTVTTTENLYWTSVNDSEIHFNSTGLETPSTDTDFEAFALDNGSSLSSLVTFNEETKTNFSQNSDLSAPIPTAVQLTSSNSPPMSCTNPPPLWQVQQNITEIQKNILNIEKAIKDIGRTLEYLKVANICSAVLTASCITPVLVIMFRLKLPPPTI